MATRTCISKDELREQVCEGCPATGWGKKTHCQVHDTHVGKIESCPEWDKFLEVQQSQGHPNGRMAVSFTEVEPALELVQRTEEEIRDYNYMQLELIRIQRFLRDLGEGMVGQYGLEAGLPKALGGHGDKTHAEVARRERKWKRLQNLQDKIMRIDEAVETIPDEQERLILEALLDGDKNNQIAKEIGVSRQRYYEIKRSAVMKMAWAMYGKQIQSTG
ncbi:hypothetical protein P9578_13835 [Brevibacillus choshinensis]|uniref:hypothetical protein n=1 Tax=Brevibacillus choshinensis TaxID=54911 RepID=UPI002E23F81B|nr:hypothetical protein [Brevibacillus choshinensis]MED4783803.1 hypothetical protein [Brevibacillus choshinensis]